MNNTADRRRRGVETYMASFWLPRRHREQLFLAKLRLNMPIEQVVEAALDAFFVDHRIPALPACEGIAETRR